MNISDAIIDAVGGLEDEIIAEVYEPKNKKRGAIIGALALAACTAIIIIGSGLLKDPQLIPDIVEPPVITQRIEETQSPEITQTPTPQQTPAPKPTQTPASQPEGIRLVINQCEPVKYYTASAIYYVDPERWEGDADADADDDADADADADSDSDSDTPEDTKRYMRYDEIMELYGISLDMPGYRMYNNFYYYPEDAHNNVFEYYNGRGNLIISICHDGSISYINSEGMIPTDIHGTRVIAAENGGVYVASFSKDGLDYFVRADRLTEDEFTKLLEVLI